MCPPSISTHNLARLLIEDRIYVQRFRVYSIFVDNSFSILWVNSLHQLMWHILCSSSVSIDNTRFKFGERDGHITGPPCPIHLSWKRLNKWHLTLTRKWHGASSWTTFVVYIIKKYFSKVQINYFWKLR